MAVKTDSCTGNADFLKSSNTTKAASMFWGGSVVLGGAKLLPKGEGEDVMHVYVY